MKHYVFLLFTLLFLSFSCAFDNKERVEQLAESDSVVIEVREVVKKEILAADIRIEKEFTYDKYTLENTYPYKDTVRYFQWEQIREILAKLENIQRAPQLWGILQNRKNKNGEAPLTRKWNRNRYKNIADTLGVERFQGIPLYLPTDSIVPERYGRDGELVRVLTNSDSTDFMHLETVYVKGEWIVPRKFVKLTDTIQFKKVVFVDRTNQNVTALEKQDSMWLVRSMNPATTGAYRPPYQHDTPLGIYVVQEKKDKMYYLVDGTSDIGGFAPYASRFTNGGYLHGIPVNKPTTAIIEYSNTLGTIPRSHMCVRLASSHAKYLYDWAPVGKSLVIVIE